MFNHRTDAAKAAALPASQHCSADVLQARPRLDNPLCSSVSGLFFAGITPLVMSSENLASMQPLVFEETVNRASDCDFYDFYTCLLGIGLIESTDWAPDTKNHQMATTS